MKTIGLNAVEGNNKPSLRTTMSSEIDNMSSHTESLVQLNELILVILERLEPQSNLSESHCGGGRPERIGLLEALSNKSLDIQAQIEIAHGRAKQISELI